MKLHAFLFLTIVGAVHAQTTRTRDGLVDSVPGYGITYHSARWEPLCGTITSMPATLDLGDTCVPALD